VAERVRDPLSQGKGRRSTLPLGEGGAIQQARRYKDVNNGDPGLPCGLVGRACVIECDFATFASHAPPAGRGAAVA